MKLAQIKIIFDDAEGTWTEATAVMPKELAEAMVLSVIQWEEEWQCSVQKTREFIREEKEFKVNRKS